MKFVVIKKMYLTIFMAISLTAGYATAGTCTYKVDSEWNTGFTASITIANNGKSAINAWNVNWKYNNNKITSSWNATLTGTNPYAAKDVGWNGTIQPGQSINFGFQGNKNGAVVERPIVTGAVCSGAVVVSSQAKSSVRTSVKSSVKASITPSSKKSSVAASSIGPVTLKGVANFPIGAALSIWGSNNIYTSTQEQSTLLKHFDAMVAENIMKPPYLHPQENTFFWADGDKLVQFAKDHGMHMHAHTLIWHNGAPAYFDNYKNNASGMKAVLKTHVDTIARHYSGKVESWDVVNEALDDGAGINGYRNSVFFQAMGSSFIDEAFKNARAADGNALLYYNDYNIESNAKYNNMIAMIKSMQQRSIPIDGVGFQMHVGLDSPSIQNIENALQGVVNLGLKIRISELDVSLNAHWDNKPAKYTSLTPALSAQQKERYRQIVAAYRKIVPSCLRTGITVWNISDNYSWLNNITEDPSGIKDPDWPVLFDANYYTKPAFDGFIAGLKDTLINNNERMCP